MATRAVAGGGRSVEVTPERLPRWLDNLAARHGPYAAELGADGLRLVCADGTTAVCRPPGLPFRGATLEDFLLHATASRRIGLLLVRLGGHAAGVFEGRELVAGRAGRRPVHGRSAAGGWSQQRFARRRAGQVGVAHAAAAELAAAILLPEVRRLDAVITGGDRAAIAAVLADVRLAPLRPLVDTRVLDVVDPRRQVLVEAIDAARSVVITLWEPGQVPAG